MTIVLDEGGTVPQINFQAARAGYITVAAHSQLVGAQGNIAAYSVKQVVCCTSQQYAGDIQASNTRAFAGGQDAFTSHTVTRADVQQAETQISGPLTLQGQTALHDQLASTQQVNTSPAVCTPEMTTDKAVGSVADQLTASGTVTCRVSAYSYTPTQAKADVAQKERVTPRFPAPFLLTSISITAIQEHGLTGPNIVLVVSGEEHWLYQWSQEQRQSLARSLAGVSTSQAETLLSRLEGVETPPTLRQSFWQGDSLPADATHIIITVSPLS